MKDINKIKYNTVWGVSVEYVGGQSSYPDKIFVGEFFVMNSPDITEFITKLVEVKSNGVDETFFVDCDDVNLKLKLISKITRNEPELEVTTEQITPGTGWGTNIFIKLGESKCDPFK